MRSALYILAALMVMAVGWWAYTENYRTQETMDELESLRHQITEAREEIAILRAEWAYLARPERLRDLVALNFDRLRLLPMSGASFAAVDEIAFPEEDLGRLAAIHELRADGGTGAAEAAGTGRGQ